MKRIFILCGWLGKDGKTVPSFFSEQAELFINEYSMSLLNLTDVYFYGIRNFIKDPFLFRKTEMATDNGLILYKFEYARFRLLPKFINKLIKERFYKYIRQELKLDKPQDVLIHVQSLYKAGFFAKDLKTRFNIPYMITEHDQFMLTGLPPSELDEIQDTFNKSSLNLVVSSDKARQILNHHFTLNYHVVGNYVDEKVFYPGNAEKKFFKIITIGAYSWIKEQQTIFEMLRELDKRDLDKEILFHYVGFDGWGKNNYKIVSEKINELKLKRIKVVLNNWVGRKEIADFLRESDLFVFSSISEGMPVSVLEALASGVPVCTTQCGGVDELIHPFNGKIISLRDHLAMCNFAVKCITGELKFNKKKIADCVVSEYGTLAFKNRMLNHYNNFFSKN